MNPSNATAQAGPPPEAPGSRPAAVPSPLRPGAQPPPPGRATPQAFETYRDGLIHKWNATLTLLGMGIIPTSLPLDFTIMPREYWGRFVAYRLLVTGVLVIWHLVLRKLKPSRWAFLHSYGLNLLVCSMVVAFTQMTGGFRSPYFGGLNLVMIAVNLMLPWKPFHVAINGSLVVALYVAVNGLWGGGPFELEVATNNIYYLSTTVVISIFIKIVHNRLIEQEFYLRSELVDANVRLDRSRAELKAARDALWSEIEVAKRIQTALLPRTRRLGPFEVAAIMIPATEVGGDYFDLIETPAGERWVCVGDVSGHGVESGLVMMMTQTSILTTITAQPGLSPSAVFENVNTVLWENISRLGGNRYMTLNVMRLEDDRLTVAGKHQDILVYRHATHEVEAVSNNGCWIGMTRDARGAVEDLQITLGPSDAVLLFTDGITEACSATGEMFGQDRLQEALARLARLPLEAAVLRLLAEVRTFADAQDDDMTVLLLRRG